MAIIKKYNAKTNTTYVYESVSYWDKELKQPRSKRKLIGKLDPVTGEVVPTGGRGRKTAHTSEETPSAVTEPNAPLPETDTTPADNASVQALYEECRRQLLETSAELAKAESTVARLQAEKQELLTQLEGLVKKLKH